MPTEEIKADLSDTDSAVDAAAQADEASAEADSAQEDVDQLRGRIAELTKRLEQNGRAKQTAEMKALKSDLAQRTVEAEEAKAKAARLERFEKWYEQNAATAEEKEILAAQRRAATDQSRQRDTNKITHLEALADEEDPTMRRYLQNLKAKGTWLGRNEIEAARETFAESSAERAEEVVKKAPPKVGGARTSGNSEPNLEDRIAKAMKAKDFIEVMNLKSQQAALQLAASKQ